MTRAAFVPLLLGLALGCGDAGPRQTAPAAAAALPPSVDPDAGMPLPGAGMRFSRCLSMTAVPGGGTLAELRDPWGDRPAARWLLVPRGRPLPDPLPEGVTPAAVLRTPLTRYVCTSTTFLPYLDEADGLRGLVGFPTADYVMNEKVRAAMASGAVKKVGGGPTTAWETVALLNPEAVLVSGFGQEGTAAAAVLAKRDIKVIAVMEFNEPHPLGQAEWRRFFTALVGQGADADKHFGPIADRYGSLVGKARTAAEQGGRPGVLLNAPYRGTWYTPGRKSTIARLVHDAGGRYLFDDLDTFKTQPLSLEKVFERVPHAAAWLNVNQWTKLADGVAEDSRLGTVPAFRAGRVYNNNRRRTPGGGSDYYETGLAHPDVVLADLVGILHPSVVPGHEFTYFQRLP